MPPTSTALPDGTLGAALAEAASRRGDSTFLIEGEAETSYAALDAAAARLAAGLAALGLGAGDRIGLLSSNRLEWVQLFFAAARLGAVVVGMSPRYRDGELGYMVRDSAVKVVMTPAVQDGHDFAAMFDRLAPELPSLAHLVLLDATPGELAAAGPLARLPFERLHEPAADDPAAARRAEAAVRPGDLAMVIYTSGTTGRPKGAGLTHASLLASARAQAAHMRLGPDDLIPLATPLNHVGGITCGILSFLAGGARIDLLPEFKAPEMLERIRRHRPTILAGVPTMMVLLLMKSEGLDIDFGGVRLVFVGGSSVDAALLAQLGERMPNATLMNLYGLSESSGAIVLTPWDASPEELMATIGRPIGDAAVQAIGIGAGPGDAPLAAGEVGELCFRGCGVVPGYVGAAASAREAFLPGGWLKTGDLGSVDTRGVITLKGRAKDMYIQGGFNVYPAEVEAHLAKHPDVLLVAGIGVPDPVLGEVGRYYVVPRPGTGVDAARLGDWCAASLADYKRPRQFVFRDALPLTPAGKIHKAALRAEAADPGAPASPTE